MAGPLSPWDDPRNIIHEPPEKKRKPVPGTAVFGPGGTSRPDPWNDPRNIQRAAQTAEQAIVESSQFRSGLVEGIATVIGIPMTIAQAAMEAEWSVLSPEGSKVSR